MNTENNKWYKWVTDPPGWLKTGFRSWPQFWFSVLCLMTIVILDVIESQASGFDVLKGRFALYAILSGLLIKGYFKLRSVRQASHK